MKRFFSVALTVLLICLPLFTVGSFATYNSELETRADIVLLVSLDDGTVIFAGPFKNFGNLIIIDHGEGYTSLLSGLGENSTEVGQTILAGEPVGTMPSGAAGKLHMEIRKNNQPLNPTDWIAR